MIKLTGKKVFKHFEILSIESDSITYKRVIQRKGRSSRIIKKIELNLPTATLHYFEKEDYENLKKIEVEISSQFQIVNNEKKSILRIIYNFFEI